MTSGAEALTAVSGDHDGMTIPRARVRHDLPTGGRIRMHTGEVIPLDRRVIIGRRPRDHRNDTAGDARLVEVHSPSNDISRSHVEVVPERDAVVVVDLHSTNGTVLVRGVETVRLHPGEATLVVDGDGIDLGDGVSFVLEGIL